MEDSKYTKIVFVLSILVLLLLLKVSFLPDGLQRVATSIIAVVAFLSGFFALSGYLKARDSNESLK